MNKTPFQTKAEFDRWLAEFFEEGNSAMSERGFGCIEEVENFFGVDFLNSAGIRFEDCQTSEEEAAWELVLPVQYQIREDNLMPQNFPCVMVSLFSNTSDRLGSVTFRFVSYVYPLDFTS